MKRLLYFIVFIFFVQFVSAQAPSLKTSVDKKEILIGEYLKFNIEASFPDNAFQVSWPNIPDSFSHFEVVTRGKIDTSQSNGILKFNQTFILTSFDSGLNILPSFPVNFSSLQNAGIANSFTDSFPINVSYSPLDSTKTFHDIKSIIEVKDVIPWWLWVAAGLLLVLLIFLIIVLVKYLKEKKSPAIFKSKLSPFDEAMQSLSQLQSDGLLQKGEIKQFHIRSGEIFKKYISRKLQINMMNKTSSEILFSLNDTLLSKADTALIANSFRMADAVKFAKYQPPVYESESALNDTKNVIQQIDKLIFHQQNLK